MKRFIEMSSHNPLMLKVHLDKSCECHKKVSCTGNKDTKRNRMLLLYVWAHYVLQTVA